MLRWSLLLISATVQISRAAIPKLVGEKYSAYLGNTNGFCVHRQALSNPLDTINMQVISDTPKSSIRVHPFARTPAECDIINGNWNTQIEKTKWASEIGEQHDRVQRWWGKQRRRARELGDDSTESMDMGSTVWILELADGAQLTYTQRANWSEQLGAPLEAYVNKHDVTGGGFYLVFTTAQALNQLYDSHQPLIASASPLPDALKISADLRAQTTPAKTGETTSNVDVTIEVLLVPGVSSSLVAVELGHALNETWWGSELTTGMPIPCCFEAHGSELVVLQLKDLVQTSILFVAEVAAANPRVLHVTAQPQYELQNKYGSWALQSGRDGGVAFTTPFWDAGIDGQGQTVGVADSGLDHEHCFFSDTANPVTVNQGETFQNLNARKVVQYIAFADNKEGEDSGHGTHVSGSVAGLSEKSCGTTCGTNAEWKGQAHNAKIAFFDIGIAGQRFLTVPNNMETILQPAYEAEARIHTNSWGSSANVYSTNAYFFDKFSYENQDFMVLVAAGNDGTSSAASDGSLGTPATGKNIVSIAAGVQPTEFWAENSIQCSGNQGTNNNACDFSDMAHFSSKGPCYDGRVKPDLTAMGKLIGSAASTANGGTSCGVQLKQGTSMATPLTAGTAALVRQYFTDGFYPTGSKVSGDAFNPMGALVKAVLIHSAQSMQGGTYCGGQQSCAAGATIGAAPSKDQGYGRVQISAALQLGASNTLFVDGACPDEGTCTQSEDGTWGNMPSVDTGTVWTKDLTVDSAATHFRATLVWHDPTNTGLLGTATALTNDLDLTVIEPDGTTALPMRMTSGGTAATGVNRLDNVEIIDLIFDAGTGGGTYTVTVTGHEVPSGPQPFAIVATSLFEEIPDNSNGQGGSGSGSSSSLEIGPFVGAVFGAIFIAGLTAVAVWYFTVPGMSPMALTIQRIVHLAAGILETVVVAGLSGDWRITGTFGLTIVCVVAAAALLTCYLAFWCAPDSAFGGIVAAVWFSTLVRCLDATLFLAWLIFAPSLASSDDSDAPSVLAAFVILLFFAVALILDLAASSSKLSKGPSSSGSSGGAYRNMDEGPAIKPKPKPKPKAKFKKSTPKRTPPKPKPKKKKLRPNVRVRAKFKFAAGDTDELDLRKGDILEVKIVQEDGWCFGINKKNGRQGVFPGNYVEVL